MKKANFSGIIWLFLVFAAFAAGFYLAGSTGSPLVQISRHPAVTQPIPDCSEVRVFPVDLNSADREALIALPGIGPALADRILSYRAAHGLFETPEELIDVEGIGPATLQNLLPYITLGGTNYENTGR